MAKENPKRNVPAVEEKNMPMPEEQNPPVSINDFIERLPKDMRGEAATIFMAMEQKSFQGPIPPPEDLQGYEEVLPGASNRIVTMAEENSKHRRSMEKTIIEGNISLSKRGQWMGFFLAIFFVLIALFLAFNGYQKLGGILITTTLIGALVIFVLHERPWESKNKD